MRTKVPWETVLVILTGLATVVAWFTTSLSLGTLLAGLGAVTILIISDYWPYKFEHVDSWTIEASAKQEAERTAVELRKVRRIILWTGPGLLLGAVCASFLWSQLPGWASSQASQYYGQVTSAGGQGIIVDFVTPKEMRFVKEPPEQQTMIVGRSEPKPSPGRRVQFLRFEEVVRALAGTPDAVWGGLIMVLLLLSIIGLIMLVIVDRVAMARFIVR